MRALWILPLLAASAPSPGRCQAPVHRSQLTLHLEPVALGARYGYAPGRRWRLGPSLTVGPFEGVTLDRGDSGRLREWATLYGTVSAELAPRFEVVLSPIGAALALGDDFSSVYPSAQVGLQVSSGRWIGGSDIRVIRIAGPSGSGIYWVQWIPLRVGIRWEW
ncbi:MAG TPA: hypothetical protein VFN96_00600 [Gemmatimonadales bacterium]|nr:hypothetical protein [Gemmatimonadales bacterium]